MTQEEQSQFSKTAAELAAFGRDIALVPGQFTDAISYIYSLIGVGKQENQNHGYLSGSAPITENSAALSGASTAGTDLTGSTATGAVLGHADGGYFTSPHMAMFAEDGGEFVIPVTGRYRQRGLSLWEQAGEMLGVKPYANGGFTRESPSGIPSLIGDSAGVDHASGGFTAAPLIPTMGTGRDTFTPIAVNAGGINVEVHIDGNASDAKNVGQTVKDAVLEALDDMLYKASFSVEQIYSNTPMSVRGV